MFGYVAPRLEDVEEGERGRYHTVYCGVCRALGRRCGQRCRLGLSYDMAFLALVLGSLYEPQEQVQARRCLMHPTGARPYASSECVDYAADMNVALAYYKCLDDWNDERSVRGKAGSAVFLRPYRAVEERNPRACAAIAQGMEAIGEIERSREESPDAAANVFGALLGEVFAWKDDFWADDLRRFGARLGKFVYLMDAVVDFEDDAKSGSYNPLVMLGSSPQDMKDDLDMLAMGAADAFERLPLERDLHLLRSVLYAGMWQRYYAHEDKAKDKETRRG